MIPLIFVFVGVILFVALLVACVFCDCRKCRKNPNLERSSSYNFMMWRLSERIVADRLAEMNNTNSTTDATEGGIRLSPICTPQVTRRKLEIIPEEPETQSLVLDGRANPGFGQKSRSVSVESDEYVPTTYGEI